MKQRIRAVYAKVKLIFDKLFWKVKRLFMDEYYLFATDKANFAHTVLNEYKTNGKTFCDLDYAIISYSNIKPIDCKISDTEKLPLDLHDEMHIETTKLCPECWAKIPSKIKRV